jgi:hypothetical protein
MFNLLGNNIGSLSSLKDPFKKDCITCIGINMFKRKNGEIRWWGRVEFTNGKTKGEQEFENYDAENGFLIMITEIDEFIKSLN